MGLKIQLADYGTVEVAKVHYRADNRPGKEAGFVVECVPAPEGDQMLMSELKEHSRLPSGQREKMVLSLTAEKEKLTLSIAEVAEILRISRALAYQAAHRGDLPGVVKFGKRIMVSWVALDRALREGWSPPSK